MTARAEWLDDTSLHTPGFAEWLKGQAGNEPS